MDDDGNRMYTDTHTGLTDIPGWAARPAGHIQSEDLPASHRIHYGIIVEHEVYSPGSGMCKAEDSIHKVRHRGTIRGTVPRDYTGVPWMYYFLSAEFRYEGFGKRTSLDSASHNDIVLNSS
jgi:hypothetical protein